MEVFDILLDRVYELRLVLLYGSSDLLELSVVFLRAPGKDGPLVEQTAR
jgi:hypothetical protein